MAPREFVGYSDFRSRPRWIAAATEGRKEDSFNLQSWCGPADEITLIQHEFLLERSAHPLSLPKIASVHRIRRFFLANIRLWRCRHSAQGSVRQPYQRVRL